MVLTDYPAKSLIHCAHLCRNDFRDQFALSLLLDISYKQNSSRFLQKYAVAGRRKIIIMLAS